ncbi:MAG TPA: hypothetical protein VJ464_28270 [Blastocatellia bacterium]|nr:hypothetical protein [Blastocatellia bacterium]
MDTIKKKRFNAIAFTLVIVAALLVGVTPTHSAPPSDKDVRVINTTAEPVPTVAQGTTTIAGTVQAKQSGAWSVGISGVPSVKVDSDPANPIYVTNVEGAKPQPFQQEVEVTVDPGLGAQSGAINVPLGKLLVIEQVSASAFPPAGQKILFSLLTHVAPDNTLRKHLLHTSGDTFGGGSYFEASQTVRVYADTPSALVHVDRDVTTGSVLARFVVSGYLIDK